jgi:peptide/nickel transport system substrate-binding protein
MHCFPHTHAAPAQRTGGALTVLYSGDVDSTDPDITYYLYGFQVTQATQRGLVTETPDGRAVPDLAASMPEVSADGRTVTVHLRAGVRFSPPVNREVTADDVRYAIERGFFRTVRNPYARLPCRATTRRRSTRTTRRPTDATWWPRALT